MVQLNTKKTALVLYGVLLVLPTVVLAGLQWYQLDRDRVEQLARVPRDVDDAARRLSSEIESRLDALLDAEGQRPFYVYRDVYFPVGTLGTEIAFVPSPLAEGPVREGVLAWFSCDTSGPRAGRPEFLAGDETDDPGWPARERDLARALTGVLAHDAQEGYLKGLARFGNWRSSYLSATIAAINLHPDEDLSCLKEEISSLRELADEKIKVNVSSFHLRFYREADGTPRIVAMRSVMVDANHRLWDVRTCIEMGRGAKLVQGFFVDPEWYFERLPANAAQAVLDPDQVFLPASHAPPAPADELVASVIRPVLLLRCETYDDADLDFARMAVALNTTEVKARLARQRWRYLGVTAMLLVSLATGMLLLLRSVHRDLEQAQRTENFVAAVTHELRTPLSAIKLYGEMLMDGWVKDTEKQEEYYRRIVRETGRLETMVERVLEKGRVTSDEAPPQPGDLTRAVRLARPTLEQLGDGRADLEFELADGLPEVLLIPDGVRSVLTNLVENARKYAPVADGAEPIRVRTLLLRGKVVLEVSDRGPGIPQGERRRIFDAFYRVGNEATRTSSGTGLGLHLVALQMRAMRGRIQVLDREGGGTTFRLTFRKTVGHETEYDVI